MLNTLTNFFVTSIGILFLTLSCVSSGAATATKCNGIDIYPTAENVSIHGVDCQFFSVAEFSELMGFYTTYFLNQGWQQSWIREYPETKTVLALYSHKKKGSRAFLTVIDLQPERDRREVKLRVGKTSDVLKRIIDKKLEKISK